MPAAKLFGEPSRLYQIESIANMGIYFGIAKEKGESFRLEPYLCIFAKIICLIENKFLYLQMLN